MTTLPPLTQVNATSAILGHDRIKEEWSTIAGRIRRRWRRLTSDDVAYSGGTAEYLARVLQDRYGVDRREALLQVYEFESEL
ncbi:MAG: CsbD family protein [Rhodanobacteraceae bacterium]